MESIKKLVRIDRNGTKYWDIIETCPHCGGRGVYIAGGFNHGTCYQCGGSGRYGYTYKEYTPEHEAKLEARRQAKAAKMAEEITRYNEEHAEEIAEQNRRIIEKRYADFGCGKDGTGYVLAGNTYPIKDEIKKNGGRWIFGAWVCPVEVKADGVTVKKVNLDGHVGSGSEVWIDGFDIFEAIRG